MNDLPRLANLIEQRNALDRKITEYNLRKPD